MEFLRKQPVKFADAVLEGNPLVSPPTLPVAAMLDGYKQPIFSGSIEDGTFDISGYVDQGSERCQTVQDAPAVFEAVVVKNPQLCWAAGFCFLCEISSQVI